MAEIDFEKELRRAVDTGKAEFGYRTSEKSMLLGKGKMLVTSAGLPARQKEKLSHVAGLSGIPVYDSDKSALKLGSICGKPFPVTAMVVLEPGKSKILAAAAPKKQ
ncbi:MAG: 50S ribosomal protein L30e [Candidatus Diapherotrites archaeon]|nr:50S ribosomal protein L30e [Candidatus Diapherotrites archaeon]